ncbi:hypothetical protein [Peterkaempfera sp. SMS 1(5)a]|uniref:hypothetical protein n=1 Tax=Peterkaempfera podocarpi TaxID=3232308 RepID=UPI00366DE437
MRIRKRASAASAAMTAGPPLSACGSDGSGTTVHSALRRTGTRTSGFDSRCAIP